MWAYITFGFLALGFICMAILMFHIMMSAMVQQREEAETAQSAAEEQDGGN